MPGTRNVRRPLTAAAIAGCAVLYGCGDAIAGPDRTPASSWANASNLSRASRADDNRARGDRDRDDRDSDDRDRERGDDDDRARRVVGRCVTTFQFLDQTRLQIDGTCEFRGFGRMTLSAQQTVTEGPSGLVIKSASTYTTAKGDQLKAGFSGSGTPDATGTVCFTGTQTFRGGTGRFRRAVGEAAVEGCATFTSQTGGTGFFSLNGRLRLGRDGDRRS